MNNSDYNKIEGGLKYSVDVIFLNNTGVLRIYSDLKLSFKKFQNSQNCPTQSKF